MCLLSIAVTPGEWFCSSCQGWSGLCSPLDGQSPEVIPLFSCPNQSPNEEANTWSTQRAGAAFPLLAALRSSLLPWGWAALSVCRIQVYINDTTPKYGLLENSGAGTQHHCSHTNSRHFTYVKKKISKILKTTTKDWTMPNPANAFPKFSSVGVTGSQCCPWEVQPQYCSHPASLHPLQTLHSSCLAISSSRDCTKQNCTHSLKWPWHLSFTTVEPEGGNTTPLKILLKQHCFKKM